MSDRIYTPGCTEDLRAEIENLTVTLLRKKQDLYRQHDSNQTRQRKRKTMAQLKIKLCDLVLQYNTTVEGDQIDEELACSLTDGYILPWETHEDGNAAETHGGGAERLGERDVPTCYVPSKGNTTSGGTQGKDFGEHQNKLFVLHHTVCTLSV